MEHATPAAVALISKDNDNPVCQKLVSRARESSYTHSNLHCYDAAQAMQILRSCSQAGVDSIGELRQQLRSTPQGRCGLPARAGA